MQGFQRYGYNQNFIENMDRIVKDVKSNPDLLIEVTEDCDTVCLACPHNKKDMCLREEGAQEKVKNMDRQVLKKLGLKKGGKISAGDISQLTDTELQSSDIEEICGDCDWKTVCLFFESRHGNFTSDE